MTVIRPVDPAQAKPWRNWRPSAAARPKAAQPRRVLLVAAGVQLAYRVLRCAAANGCDVFALAPPASSGLARSRFCRGYAPTRAAVDGAGGEALLDDINRMIAAWGIDLVLPGDAPSTRSLIALRARIAAPCFPTPDLGTFDALNDKWSFNSLCAASGLKTPATWLFPDREALAAALKAGELPAKTIAKPLSRSGSEGCIVIEPKARAAALARIDYAPILVQAFVDGEDIDASVYCERGVVTEFVCYTRGGSTYRTHAAPAIREDLGRLLGPLAADGVYNFDIRRDPGGALHYIECNPRFYFSMDLSMVGGTDFLAPGLGGERPRPEPFRERAVRSPKAILLGMAKPWRIERESWRALGFVLADPVPYLREALHLERR